MSPYYFLVPLINLTFTTVCTAIAIGEIGKSIEVINKRVSKLESDIRKKYKEDLKRRSKIILDLKRRSKTIFKKR